MYLRSQAFMPSVKKVIKTKILSQGLVRGAVKLYEKKIKGAQKSNASTGNRQESGWKI